MSKEQLTQEAIALPLAERVRLAQTLWESIGEGLVRRQADEEAEAIALAQQRDAELSSGAAPGRTHEQVMEAARRAIGCD